MDVARAREILNSTALDDPGSFYGSADGLSLGVGLVIANVEYPVFDQDRQRFTVRAGLVYVLSHECDLDPANVRFLNGAAVVCPILPLANIISDATAAAYPDDELGAFLGNVGARRAVRCVYMAPIAEHLPDGGLLNLNLICSTAISRLQAGQRVAAVSGAALMSIDAAIEQHLRREKAERLPLSEIPLRRGRSIIG
jgi:hypothetical protein